MAKKTAKKKSTTKKSVEALRHEDASRKNIPTAEYQSVMHQDDQAPVRVAYDRRNRDLDPQLVWRGKDEQDWSDLVVHAPPLYIQEKVKPKVLIDDLLRQSDEREKQEPGTQLDLFSDFNGLPSHDAKTEFYQHDANWTNRMILGDSLQVMACLAEREGMRGKVQCAFVDPPYGIKFNSNFQWSTTSRDVKDGSVEHITREPEQVKAFRDTWRDGIHSYLTYLRDRLTAIRDLLTDSGSIFVQIGDENEHLVRSLLDEVFGATNHCSTITFVKTSAASSELLGGVNDLILWYAKDKSQVKYRQLFFSKVPGAEGATGYTKFRLPDGTDRPLTRQEKELPSTIPKEGRVFATDNITSQRPPGDFPVTWHGKTFRPVRGYWKTGELGFTRLIPAERIAATSGGRLAYVRFLDDFPAVALNNVWTDTLGQNQFGGPKTYVVQTALTVIQRCLLMTTDPGDVVIDPTMGSGSTAFVAEKWGRRWITIDTSRVALALARARIMGARYPFFILADSREGQHKEAQITRSTPSATTTHGNIKHGFVYQRVPHITLKSIANNAEIEVIWENFQNKLEPLREKLNILVKQKWEEWEIPREVDEAWSAEAKKAHTAWWKERIARQKEIDASIAAKADSEFLYDKPYEDNSKVRVAGPFTVESLSPHRVMTVGADDELIDPQKATASGTPEGADFAQIILENLKTAGVQQAHKEDKINFSSLTPWPGNFICADAPPCARHIQELFGDACDRGATGSGSDQDDRLRCLMMGSNRMKYSVSSREAVTIEAVKMFAA